MYDLALGTNLVKYNPIYTVSDRPNIALRKPVSTPVVRWEFYKMEFKNIYEKLKDTVFLGPGSKHIHKNHYFPEPRILLMIESAFLHRK